MSETEREIKRERYKEREIKRDRLRERDKERKIKREIERERCICLCQHMYAMKCLGLSYKIFLEIVKLELKIL